MRFNVGRRVIAREEEEELNIGRVGLFSITSLPDAGHRDGLPRNRGDGACACGNSHRRFVGACGHCQRVQRRNGGIARGVLAIILATRRAQGLPIVPFPA